MLCHYCEQEQQSLPFRCNYCGNYFCAEHRLPENHTCPRVGGPKQPGYASVAPVGPRISPRGNSNLQRTGGRSRFKLRYPPVFSSVERKHVFIATALMVAVGVFWDISYSLSSALAFVLIFGGSLVSYLGHELSHKFMAQRNGLWAEFRTNLYMLLLTAISIPFPFKFLVPGQTNIVGNGDSELYGLISLVGPGFNLALGIGFYLAGRLLAFPALGLGFFILASFNGWIALLNLIPFPGFDGLRAFEWDKTRWGVAFAVSIVLVALTFGV